jgi:transcriptional regulator with XRE-family HTH domain
MIKNDRQYRLTKTQLREFDAALEQLATIKTKGAADASLITLQQGALQSQREEMFADVEEYESLRKNKVTSFTVETFAELPTTLIKSRIALGLTQKALADRLGAKEQQIQRWEASDYAGASIDTILAIMGALGVETREEVFVPNERLTPKAFFENLSAGGIPKDLVLQRLIPASAAARLSGPMPMSVKLREILQAASGVSRVFGVSVTDLLALDKPDIDFSAVAAARFKLPASASHREVNAYTVYAHYLALLTENCTPSTQHYEFTSWSEFRERLVRNNKPLTLRRTLEFLWDHGVMVLPLRDPGGFHGAVWKIRNRFVIVLKQNTPLESRWLYDVLHEIGHIALGHVSDERAVVEEHPISPNIHTDGEDDASEWAEDVIFGGKSEQIEEACAEASQGRLERLKAVLPEVAKRFNVDLGVLANHMAYRLEDQGENWWGAAHNLQIAGTQPFDIARELLFQYANLLRLNPIDRDLLMRALTD